MKRNSNDYDVILVGAGAAGLFCAGFLSKSKMKVLVLEKNSRIAKKLIISGGGRCNFTNLKVDHSHFQGENTHFPKSALAQFSQHNFLEIVQKGGLSFYEKKMGQLFCEKRSKDLLDILLKNINQDFCEIRLNSEVESIQSEENTFEIKTRDNTRLVAPVIVIASGGLSFPKIGVSDVGYKIAKQFHHDVVKLSPSLVPLGFGAIEKDIFSSLSGLSLPVEISCKNGKSYTDDLLFTHLGLSGPAILKASLHWSDGERLKIRFLFDDLNWTEPFSKILLKLKNLFPKRFVESFMKYLSLDLGKQELSKKEKEKLKSFLLSWSFVPKKNLGYDKAEVTKGGVSTRHISSKTMESLKKENLYFIGEVLDVTGELGGYNFQWAWSSAYVAAQDIIQKKSLLNE